MKDLGFIEGFWIPCSRHKSTVTDLEALSGMNSHRLAILNFANSDVTGSLRNRGDVNLAATARTPAIGLLLIYRLPLYIT